MRRSFRWGVLMAGAAAGLVNGLFGAGGGMVLIPLLYRLSDLEEDVLFPSSVVMILPMCLISLAVTFLTGPVPVEQAFPYMIGSAAGGFIAGKYGRRISARWLHRSLGVMILWGGFRYLC